MQFFKGYKDVKDLICAKVEFADLLALKAVNKDCQDYINKHHLDKSYRYCLGSLIQIGEMGRSVMSYKFPTLTQVLESFPKVGTASLFAKRGDAKEAVKAVHKIDAQDRIMTKAIFLVKLNLPREPDARRLVSYKAKDEVNGTVDKCTMMVNDVEVKHLVPCRVMIIDDQNRIIKHNFINNRGKVQHLNYMELTLAPELDAGQDEEFSKSHCVIL
jgi:hypothetical protein